MTNLMHERNQALTTEHACLPVCCLLLLLLYFCGHVAAAAAAAALAAGVQQIHKMTGRVALPFYTAAACTEVVQKGGAADASRHDNNRSTSFPVEGNIRSTESDAERKGGGIDERKWARESGGGRRRVGYLLARDRGEGTTYILVYRTLDLCVNP